MNSHHALLIQYLHTLLTTGSYLEAIPLSSLTIPCNFILSMCAFHIPSAKQVMTSVAQHLVGIMSAVREASATQAVRKGIRIRNRDDTWGVFCNWYIISSDGRDEVVMACLG
jgi:hypothetical protein